MEPNIINREQFLIVGMVYYGNPFQEIEVAPDQNEVGKLWARFSTYYDNNPQVFKGEVNPKVGWELHITTDEYEDTKEYYVMVGVEMSEIADLPLPTFAKVLPAGQYAVFTLKGEEMVKDWGKAIYKEWLPSSDYKEAFQCTIERYDEDRFKGWGDPESEVEIWVPINVKG
jgi:predicted transcriptional regulator YdeE